MEEKTAINISLNAMKQNSGSSSVSYPNTRRDISHLFKRMDKPLMLPFQPVRIDELMSEFEDMSTESPPKIFDRRRVSVSSEEEESTDENLDENRILDMTFVENATEVNAQSFCDQSNELISQLKNNLVISENKNLSNEQPSELIIKGKPEKKDDIKDLKNIESQTKNGSPTEFENPFAFISEKKNTTNISSIKKTTDMKYVTPKKDLVCVAPTSKMITEKVNSVKKVESSVLCEKNLNILPKNHRCENIDNKKLNVQFSMPINHLSMTPKLRNIKSLDTQMQILPKIPETPMRIKMADNTRICESKFENMMRNQKKFSTPLRMQQKQVETPMRMPKQLETPIRMSRQVEESVKLQQKSLQTPVRVQTKSDVPLKISNEPASNSDKKFRTMTVKGKEYIVISKLGEGGSCQVFDCLEPNTLEHRAIKMVNLAVDVATANGYINEVKMLRALQGSEYVIKMFDYEITKQTLFVIMEKGGIDLSIFLRNIAAKSSRLPVHVINYFWMEMLNCVKEIHDAGIIHSDLKPSNFLIVDGRLKLIDFGIASRLSSDMTSVIKNVQVGTFNYISPEAILDSRTSEAVNDGKPRIKISYKSDVWSLGCILYQLVYRKTPFHYIGNTLAKISMIIDPNHTIEYPKIEGVPAKCIEIIQKCLQYDIKRRPTVSELISSYNAAIC